jgi:hypothetical protein
VLFGAVLTGMPAAHAADDPTLPLVVNATDVRLPPAGSGDPHRISWSLAPPSGGTADDVHVTLDLSGISSFATGQGPCEDDVCAWSADELDADGMGGTVDLDAAPDAPPGTTGTAVLSGTAADATITPVTVHVTVGPAGTVQLEVGGLPPVSHAKPGSTVDAPFVIADTGQLPADGVDLRLAPTGGLGFAQHFANCDYGTAPTDPGPAGTAVCHIATTLAPGTRYQLSAPFGLTVAGSALWESVRYSVAPGTGGAPTAAGGGPVLSLVPDGSAPTGGSASHTWTVDADNTADLTTGGDSVHGAPGDEVTVTAQLANLGPATVDGEADGEGAADRPAVMVDLPQGTTALKVPTACKPWNADGPGAPATDRARYLCAAPDLFAAGQVVRLPFTLRIDADAPATATGTVRATSVQDGGLSFDPDRADDSAPLIVQVQDLGATATPSAAGTRTHASAHPGSGSAGGTGPGAGPDAPSPGGGSGALASTGNRATQVLAWTGSAALAFGGAAFAVARSRRIRHR